MGPGRRGAHHAQESVHRREEARAAAKNGAKYTTPLRNGDAFSGGVIEIEIGFFQGAHWGGGLHSHIAEHAVYGRRADGSPLTAADALIPLESARGLDIEALAAALARAFPGARIEILDAQVNDDQDEGEDDQWDQVGETAEPILTYERTDTCGDDHSDH